MSRSDQQTNKLIHFRYREGLSFEETGRPSGQSANSARKLWARAIERLDHELREMFSP
jgi:DNA-directed RNA polymerase specialized sigma24 family protein